MQIKLENVRNNLLWSLHIRHKYLFEALNIWKDTAVCSVKSFEAKANKPNGPILPLLDAYCLLHNS